MIAPISPPLQGIAAERFLNLARALNHAAERNRELDRQSLLNEEIAWMCAHLTEDSPTEAAYEAAVRVLIDLERLGWKIREEGYGLELVAERPRRRSLTPEQIRLEKNKTQAMFRPMVQAQLKESAVGEWVKRLESHSVRSGKKSVSCLIAEGAELHARLLSAGRNSDGEDDPLAAAIRPYLQWATVDEADEFNGHSLRDIWRYFRYSWSIPQFSTPGRQLLYLVRDAAHPCHAVIGIIGLNNGILQMGMERENYLGWSLSAVTDRLRTMTSAELLITEYHWMEAQIAAALDDIDPTALATPDDLANPSRETIAILQRRSQGFDKLRDETLLELARVVSGEDMPVIAAESEEFNDDHPPVDEAMLSLELKLSMNPTMQKARRHLVARKRSALLAELLHARLTLREQRALLTDPDRLHEALARKETEIAVVVYSPC